MRLQRCIQEFLKGVLIFMYNLADLSNYVLPLCMLCVFSLTASWPSDKSKVG